MTCPECHCEDLYKEKAFPKKIGIGIIAIAAVLSFWTYHISLIVAAIIDALIYKFVSYRLVCYRCKKTLENKEIPDEIKVHDQHIAELYNSGQVIK